MRSPQEAAPAAQGALFSENSDEIIFEERTCGRGLKKKQGYKDHPHVLAPLPNDS